MKKIKIIRLKREPTPEEMIELLKIPNTIFRWGKEEEMIYKSGVGGKPKLIIDYGKK